MNIVKRNGSEVIFEKDKVVNAIIKAMNETDAGIDEELAWDIAEDIELEFEDSDVIPTIESVSDRVEELLAENGRFDASKRYILYRQERSKLRNQGWEMNELQRDVYERKYRFNNESFDEFIDRVSGGNESMAKLIRNKDFLFGGRILAGRGINRNVSLANCTTLPPVEDSIEGIFDAAKELARMFSYGQGCGVDLSKLRPKGAKVNNASKTSTGAVSFMQVFDTVSDVIGAEGRRAALLMALDANHKDILDFINIKNDVNKINNANISVKVDDEFMKQDTEEKRKVLRAIAESSWATGEPAILGWDNNKRWHLLSADDEYEVQGVNACQPKGELILTEDGYQKIEDIKDHIVLNGVKYKSTPMFKTGRKKVYTVELENGTKIRMTDDHEVTTPSGDKMLKELSVGDRVIVDYAPIFDTVVNNVEDYHKGILLGFLLADGTIYNYKYGGVKGYFEFSLGEKEFKLKDSITKVIQQYDINFEFKPHSQKPKSCMVGRIYNFNSRQTIMKDLKMNDINDKFNINYLSLSKDIKLGLLRGLFTCDGSSRTNSFSALYSINKDFLSHVQRILKEFGIYSNLTIHNYTREDIMKDGSLRRCKDAYKLDIYDNEFYKIGYLTEYKQQTMLNNLIEPSSRIEKKKKQLKIKSIQLDGVEDVFDITVDEVHHYNTNGLVVHNCSEYPTTGYGTCLLGSINLSNYVLNPFTENARINKEKLAKDVQTIVVGMNEVLDEAIPTHPLQQQRDIAKNYRQIGVGISLLGDFFIKMGVKYGSKESIKLASEVMEIIRDNAILSSVKLAKKNGSFPRFNFDKMKESAYFKSLPQYIQEEIKQHGIRNSSLLSIAPAGSLSLLMDGSNGLEPIFSNSFIRTTKSLGAVDKEYKVYASVIKELMEVKGITKEEDLPDCCVTAHDIDPFDRIELQSELQKYVDLAISSTINLNEDTSVETVEEIYKVAYAKGLKGISIFRNNCLRKGILNIEDKEEKQQEQEVQEECAT